MWLVSKEQIEELYIKQGLTKAETAKMLGIGKTTLYNYCKKYGIETRNRWTDEEVYYLEMNFGKYPLEKLAKKLNKTETAIRGKCGRLGLTGAFANTGYINTNDVAKAIGVDRKTVSDWIRFKGLPAKKKVFLKKRMNWHIDVKDLWVWLEKNKDWINLSKLEKNILGPEPSWVDEKRREDINKKIRKHLRWSQFEIDHLKANYRIKSYKEIADELGRTTDAVQIKAKKLGLKKIIELTWQPVEVEMLMDMKMKGLTDIDVANELGRSFESVAAKRKELIRKGILNWKYRKTVRG